MSRIITASKLNRLWKNGVLNIKQALESSINTEKTERKAEIAIERERIDELEENGGSVANKLSSYDDIMANEVEGYLPDAIAVKEGFMQVNGSLGGLRFGTDGDGNVGYYGADDSLIPFSSKGKVAFAFNVLDKSNTYIDIGFRPRILFFARTGDSYSSPIVLNYNEHISKEKYWKYAGSQNATASNIGTELVEITDTGFSVADNMVGNFYSYLALGYLPSDDHLYPLIPASTKDIDGNTVAYSASSSYSGYPANRPFDGDDTTRWISNTKTASGTWLKVDLGTERTVKEYKIIFYSDVASSTVQLQASNTGTDSDWTTLTEDTIDGLNATIKFENSTPYRYYRIYFIDQTMTRDVNSGQIATLQLYGHFS